MKTTLPITLLCGLCLAQATALLAANLDQTMGQELPDGRSITVRLASGRAFTGQFDPRTDATKVWLRCKEGSAEVIRPIRWGRVLQASVVGRQVSGEQLQEIVAEIRREIPAQAEKTPGPSDIVMKGAVAAADAGSTDYPTTGEKLQPLPVRSLAVEALAANWDADAEDDGLLVRIYALDDAARPVPVCGTVRLELSIRPSNATPYRPRAYLLEQWTRRIWPEDLGPRGVVIRLPYRRLQAEFNPALSLYGTLHARLSIPGQGTFEAVARSVRLLP